MDTSQEPPAVRHVVCVGSSAGGLEALGAFLSSLPVDLPICYVVAQHVAPTHDSPLRGLLARATTLRVEYARDRAPLEPGVVLIAPPGADVTVDDRTVRLVTPARGPGPSPSIDVLLRSAAGAWGDKVVAVVLSGTGHDGSAGVVAVRSAGGVSIAQDFAGAGFAAMPEGAVATGAVDMILPAGRIGGVLLRLARGEGVRDVVRSDAEAAGTASVEPESAEDGPEDRRTAIDATVATVLAMTGVDFAGYKRATLTRQVERRMGALAIDDMARYRATIAADTGEAATLTKALLVTVTSFFRDPTVWQALVEPMRVLLAGRDEPGPVRLWVPGCATGQEAYTLGMVVAGLLGNPGDLGRRLKIFATDLDDDALQSARAGQYPDDGLDAIPPVLRRRWLRRSGDGWGIGQSLRDCVIFARHNVARDPPFPNIHLVSLRNTLIYFEPRLQEQTLRRLHLGMVPSGLLLLGRSERIADNHDLFEPLESENRIYVRRTTATRGLAALPSGSAGPTPSQRLAMPHHSVDRRAVLRTALIRRFAPPCLVLDEGDQVIEVVGDVSRWCSIAEGQHSSNVATLVREELRTPVRSLVLRVRQGISTTAERSVTTGVGMVVITVRRLDEPDAGSGWMVVSFAESDTTAAPAARDGGAPDARQAMAEGSEITRVMRELASTETALQATIEQLSTSNDELQTLNEELQAAAEELQASNEEVQASNEELEATNEELSILNSELQQRGIDLSMVNSDLENIQASLTSGLVLVDRDLRVMRYTALAVRLFALIESDVGRPLTAIPSTMAIPELEQRLRAAVDRHEHGLLELRGERSDMLLHFHPYRGEDGAIRGAILVSTDISELAGAHRAAQRSLRDLVAVTDALREAVWQRSENGLLLFLNPQVERLFGVSRHRLMQDPGLLLTAVHPEDRERVSQAWAVFPAEPYELEYRILRPDGGIRWVHESVSIVAADKSGPGYAVVSALDVTDRRDTERGAGDTVAVLEAVFENSVFGVLVLDEHDRIVRINDRVVRMSGYAREALVGMPVRLLTQDADPVEGSDPVPESELSGPLVMGIANRRLLTRDGTPYQVTMEIRALDGGSPARIVIVHDVTRLHEVNHELAAQAKFDQQTGLLARAHFRDLLGKELARADRSGAGLAVLWIDLDGFKEVNDRHGHQAGDHALREVASRLQQTSRRQDAVGRLGGDEFAMLVTDVDQVDSLESITQRVLVALREPIQLHDTQLYLSGSIGVALAPEDGIDPDVLLRHADTAMYSAKSAGRDRRLYFRSAMNRTAEARAGIRHDLAAALRARRFTMYYQPIVDMATGAVRSVEALVRWNREGGAVPATDFMSVAEQTGQLRAVGQIALDLINDDLDVLHAELRSRPLTVCINLSPTQLDERDLLDRLVAWEPAGGFEQLVIEVTEAAAVARGGRAVETLNVLRRLGARLSIDDFGTGYSNLALLDRLRPSIIKIDRSLLTQAVEQPRGHAVLAAAIQLAHALEAEVVVEGVENRQLWDLTRTLGVEYAQGFHVARPMPLPQLIRWMEER